MKPPHNSGLDKPPPDTARRGFHLPMAMGIVRGRPRVVQPGTPAGSPVCGGAGEVPRTTGVLGRIVGSPPLRGNAQHVEQVVVNLLTNALEALPDRQCGGTVTTACDAAEHRVVPEVRDEGVGIAPEHLARLCDSFFTTKQERGETGLGLAITASLVRLHGGRLTFTSEPGKGTRVLVTFPYHHEEKPIP
jgi:signal transduction histidine kinase